MKSTSERFNGRRLPPGRRRKVATRSPQHRMAAARLEWAQVSRNADTKFVTWMKRRLVLFRALDAENLMREPRVID